LPSRECGAFAAQPEHGAGNLLRSPEATDGLAGFHRLMTFVAVSHETLQHRRHDRAGADRIHANAPPGIVERRRLGETHDAVLGGNISGHRRDPPQSREEQLTIEPPPWRSICRISWTMHCQTPVRFTASRRSQFSGVHSAVSLGWPSIPALLNAASSRPKRSTVRSTMAFT